MSSVVIASYNKNKRTAQVSWDKHDGYVVTYNDSENAIYSKTYYREPNAIKAAIKFINRSN